MASLTEEQFRALLKWLDPDEHSAAMLYERIRKRLIVFFEGRDQVVYAAELADEVFDRVAKRLTDGVTIELASRWAFFRGVATNILKEQGKKPQTRELDEETFVDSRGNADVDEGLREILEECLQTLPEESRSLILGFYSGERRAKIDNRQRIADELGITIEVLRSRAHRIRVRLAECSRRSANGLRVHRTGDRRQPLSDTP